MPRSLHKGPFVDLHLMAKVEKAAANNIETGWDRFDAMQDACAFAYASPKPSSMASMCRW